MPHTFHAPIAGRALIVVATMLSASPTPPVTIEPARLAWHLAPSSHYSTDVQMTHTVSFDMNSLLRKFAGSRADTTIIIEQRSVALTAGDNGKVDCSTIDVRRYGGDHPKDTSIMRRTLTYKGSMDPNGRRTPSDEPLIDAGDGALAELPNDPLVVGGSWTFVRNILVEREIGRGTMSYTDTVTHIDTRGNHRIAVIDVKGVGRVDVFQELQDKGFRTADMAMKGTAEFDLTTGLPGVQHYTAHAEWAIRPMGVHIGLVFDDTYDAAAWTSKAP